MLAATAVLYRFAFKVCMRKTNFSPPEFGALVLCTLLCILPATGAAPQFIVTDAMRQHSQIRTALYFIYPLYTSLALILLLQSGALSALESWARRTGPGWLAQFAIFFFTFSVIFLAVKLPIAYYSGFVVPHYFGLSDASFGRWATDLLKAQGVSWLITWFLSMCVLWAVSKFPTRWWLLAWAATVPLTLAGIFLMPLVFDPLFNKYTPMAEGRLRTSIQDLAARAGIPNAPIYQVDKSKQTRTYNAYVTGIGSSARIVIWDNTMQLPQDETIAIVGHELGHYQLGHVLRGCSFGLAGLFLFFFLAGRYAVGFLKRLPQSWGVRSTTSFVVVPVAYLVTTVVFFLVEPISNAISRQMESQADQYALTVTGNGEAMARTFVSLSSKNLSDPDPPMFVEFWSFSHPSLRRRYDRALNESTR